MEPHILRSIRWQMFHWLSTFININNQSILYRTKGISGSTTKIYFLCGYGTGPSCRCYWGRVRWEYSSNDSALFTFVSDRFGGILTAIHLKEKLKFNNFLVRLLAQMARISPNSCRRSLRRTLMWEGRGE